MQLLQYHNVVNYCPNLPPPLLWLVMIVLSWLTRAWLQRLTWRATVCSRTPSILRTSRRISLRVVQPGQGPRPPPCLRINLLNLLNLPTITLLCCLTRRAMVCSRTPSILRTSRRISLRVVQPGQGGVPSAVGMEEVHERNSCALHWVQALPSR